ncbi:MAG: hypothetical protein ACOCPD_04685 [Segatella copri]
MKNREKYRDEILNSVFRGKGEAYCEFAKKNVLQNLTDCTNGECEELHSCMMCRCIFAFWLDEEYEEPQKPEVDWSKVPVDTLVRVRDREEQEWILRYFKGINEDSLRNRYEAWECGATSVTAEGGYTNWKYCELAEDEDDGSN